MRSAARARTSVAEIISEIAARRFAADIPPPVHSSDRGVAAIYFSCRKAVSAMTDGDSPGGETRRARISSVRNTATPLPSFRLMGLFPSPSFLFGTRARAPAYVINA